MQIKYFVNYEAMSEGASQQIAAKIIAKPDLLLCAASGSSPLGAYRKLAENNSIGFEQLRIIKLDEWGGIEMNNPQSCESFLQEHVLKPMEIHPDRYITFQTNPKDKEAECRMVSTYLENNGPIDLCVLGLGLNGHIAFNEPANFLQPFAHVAELSGTSMQHPMASQMNEKPSFGLTLGMAEILQSRKIIIAVTGSKKKEIVRDFLSGKITTRLPASFLWLHPNVECLVDQTVFDD